MKQHLFCRFRLVLLLAPAIAIFLGVSLVLAAATEPILPASPAQQAYAAILALIAQQKFEMARTELLALIARVPEFAPAYARLARVYQQLGQIRAGNDVFARRLAEKIGFAAGNRLAQAELARLNGDFKIAFDGYWAVMAEAPSWLPWAEQLGLTLARPEDGALWEEYRRRLSQTKERSCALDFAAMVMDLTLGNSKTAAALERRSRQCQKQIDPNPRQAIHLEWYSCQLQPLSARSTCLQEQKTKAMHAALREEEGIGLLQLARTELAQDRLRQAIESLKESIWIFSETDQPDYLYEANLTLGQACLITENGSEAIKYFQRALKVGGSLHSRHRQAEANLAIAQGWMVLGHWEKAGTYLDHALNFAQLINEPRLLGQTLAAFQEQKFFLRDWPAVIKYYEARPASVPKKEKGLMYWYVASLLSGQIKARLAKEQYLIDALLSSAPTAWEQRKILKRIIPFMRPLGATTESALVAENINALSSALERQLSKLKPPSTP
jgi:tetratricopeptide (TPR) repeat protein